MSLFCGSFGVNAKAALKASNAIDGAPADFSSGASRFEILAENLVYSDSLIGGRGITGEIDPVVNHLRQGQRLVTGGLVMEAGPSELELWINAALGSDNKQAKKTWTAVPYDLMMGRDKVAHIYRHCIINQASIRCRTAGEDANQQIMQVALNFVGVEEHASTFPTGLALPTGTRLFWILADSVLTLDGDEFPIMNWDLTIRNNIQPLFRNKMVPGCFRLLGREITLDVDVPFHGDSSGPLFDADFDGAGSIEMVSDNLPAAQSAYTTVFTFNNLRRIQKRASTTGRGEIPLGARFQAYRDGDTNPLVITNAAA